MNTQGDKRITRITTGLWFGCVVGLMALAGCPGTMPTNDGDGTETDPDSGIQGKYAGSTICMVCHSNTHSEWSGTLHAHALATLEDIGQDKNPECLPCHTVGYGDPDGFVDTETTLSLANVGCESCHGPAAEHIANVNIASLRPPVNISADVCGACHTGEHHPNYDEWLTSKHAMIEPVVEEDVVGGSGAGNCGRCHIGEVFYLQNIANVDVPEDYFAGADPKSITPIACAICHDPHMQTGLAVQPGDGRDFQLRYAEARFPIPMNSVEAATDKTRFNLCGQCHYSRGRTWDATSRGPHHSVQSNVYAGEMPMPEGMEDNPLVLSRVSVHSFANEQCATCHLYRQDFMSDVAPAIAGHTYEVNENACATAGCHPSMEQAVAARTTLQTEVQARLDAVAAALGDPANWEYSAEGGPDADGQAMLSDEIKQARFLYHYLLSDGSLGVHNPDYARDILDKADELLVAAKKKQ